MDPPPSFHGSARRLWGGSADSGYFCTQITRHIQRNTALILVFLVIYNTGQKYGARHNVHAQETPNLCEDVLGSLSTLGGLPVDILSRHLDVTGFAVDTAVT